MNLCLYHKFILHQRCQFSSLILVIREEFWFSAFIWRKLRLRLIECSQVQSFPQEKVRVYAESFKENLIFLFWRFFWALRFSVKISKQPKPRCEKHPQTWIFMGCLTVRWNNRTPAADQARFMGTHAQTDASSEKNTLDQSRSTFSVAHAKRFSMWTSESRDFCLVGRYCTFASANLHLMVFILTCSPFSASLALASHSRRFGLRLNSATIILSSLLDVARVSPFPGRSSTVFVSLYRSTHICTKCLDFLSTLAAAEYERCGPRAWVHKKTVS